VEALNAEAFAPFGKVLAPPSSGAVANGPGWQWWGEIAALPNDGRRWTFGYLALELVPMRIDWAECHLRSPEVVLAAGGDIAVYAGPPSPRDGSRKPEGLRVFQVPAGSGVVLKPGVWHGAPFTVTGPGSAWVLLLEGTGRDDVTLVRFADEPVVVEHGPIQHPSASNKRER
jgi:ureidoglycolate lyase